MGWGGSVPNTRFDGSGSAFPECAMADLSGRLRPPSCGTRGYKTTADPGEQA